MYLSGFGNYHQTEAIPGALPLHQNSPQICKHDLFPEQISGSAFTRPRHTNFHSWVYRKSPSVKHFNYEPMQKSINESFAKLQSPNAKRWSAFEKPTDATDFIDGLVHIAGNNHANSYIYQCNLSMNKKYFNNYDGELLFIPYNGDIILVTEFGKLEISPGKIAVIPRGIAFRIELKSNFSSGYLCENQGLPLTLPELGPIGTSGLANPRHFLYPTASIEDTKDVTLICKYQHNLWISKNNTSPINIIAWHGNYAPYSYDLSLFNTINTVSFDHPDPSIFTVLTSPSEIPGVANLDFVIFPPRWMVAENTFRPPYFHRNIMSEFMGLVTGVYDAKSDGFEVGGISIHNCMTPHGPDAATYTQAVKQDLQPDYYKDTLAFMLEAKDPWLYTETAYENKARQTNYTDCWQEF
ncbi:MAG: homogentisate 1,2-dioxygenase [Legionellales bacterium RIFCSPHIGHO2_12_FULL_35_11]|nr:MAG: homogentisate 1,2-dioxygenase [Legionellales bacterium RIFCSPHIGHO2_12_FULL_35_11]